MKLPCNFYSKDILTIIASVFSHFSPPVLRSSIFILIRDVAHCVAAGYIFLKRMKQAVAPFRVFIVISGSEPFDLFMDLEGKVLSVKSGDIPSFAQYLVTKMKLRLLDCSALIPTINFRGRFCFYEGYDMKKIVLPVNVRHFLLLVNVVLVTKSAGALNPSNYTTSVMSFVPTSTNPQQAGKKLLVGSNGYGLWFAATYSDSLREAAALAGK